jgi:RNA polymerase sigma-70 factor (ECF subfamily)
MVSLLRGHRARSTRTPGPLPQDDLALVIRARQDRQAFAALYDAYVDPVYRYCFRRLGSRESAEDATSLVFAKALAALPEYRGDNPSFRSWLFAIAHNVIADELRACRHDQPLTPLVEVVSPTPTPEEEVVRSEEHHTVRTLLTVMLPSEARLLELRLAGLTGAEIATVLGMTPGAVRFAHHRAVAHLRALLTDKGEAPHA